MLNLAQPQRRRRLRSIQGTQLQLVLALLLTASLLWSLFAGPSHSAAPSLTTPPVVPPPQLAAHPLAEHAWLWQLTLSSLPPVATLQRIDFTSGSEATWQLTLVASHEAHQHTAGTLWLSDWLMVFKQHLQAKQWTAHLVSSSTHGGGYRIVVEVTAP